MIEFTKEEFLRIYSALLRVDGALSTIKPSNDFQSNYIVIEVEESIDLMNKKFSGENGK